jgi:hypothetical protein
MRCWVARATPSVPTNVHSGGAVFHGLGGDPNEVVMLFTWPIAGPGSPN